MRTKAMQWLNRMLTVFRNKPDLEKNPPVEFGFFNENGETIWYIKNKGRQEREVVYVGVAIRFIQDLLNSTGARTWTENFVPLEKGSTLYYIKPGPTPTATYPVDQRIM